MILSENRYPLFGIMRKDFDEFPGQSPQPIGTHRGGSGGRAAAEHCRIVLGLCRDLAVRLWRRPRLGAADHGGAAALVYRGSVQRSFCAVRLPARRQHGQLRGDFRRAHSRAARRARGAGGAARPADDSDHRGRRALRPLRRPAGAAPHADWDRRGGGRIDARHRRQDGAAPVQRLFQELGRDRPHHSSCDLRRHRHPALAVAARSARDRAGEHRRRVSQHRNAAMKSESGALFTLAAFFAVTSLFAVGGGNSVIPEMHRYAVDVQHWLTDRQFADSFALAQLTPGPNLIIVTLIGYHVAGIAGAVVATLAMCGPTSLLAFLVGRASQRFTGATWHGALSRGFVPVAIGLTAASAAVIVSVADRSWVAAAITLATAAIALFMRIHPLWAFAAAALLGLAGLV